MGTACCSSKSHSRPLSGHPAKPLQPPDSEPADVSDLYARVDDLFAFNPTKASAETLKAARRRLYDHLDTTPQERKSGIRLLHNKVQTLFRLATWSHKDVFDLRVVIDTVGELGALSPLKFVSLAYLIAGELVQRREFPDLRESLYATLEASPIEELEEVEIVTGKFLQGLAAFCRDNRELTGEKDVRLMRRLVTAMLASSNEADPKFEKWYPLVDILLERLVIDVRSENLALVQEERFLLLTLCNRMITSERSTHLLCAKVLSYIEERRAWGKFAEATLSIVIEAVLMAKGRYNSHLLKTLITTVQSLLTRDRDTSGVLELVSFIVRFLKEVKEPVPTIMYTNVSFMQVLQSVVLALFENSELEASAAGLLRTWCAKTDIQSCLRFLNELVKLRCTHPYSPRCLSLLKKCIRPRVLRDWDMSVFHENWNQLLSAVLHSCSQTYNRLMFQLVDFLMTLLGTKMKVRVHDVQVLNRAALQALKTDGVEMTGEWFKTCKYCCQIWLCLAALKITPLLPSLVKTATSIQTLVADAENPPVHATLSVLLLVLAHALGTHYAIQGLLEFVDTSCEEIQKLNVYPDLFTYKKWETIDDCSLCLFRKGELFQFQSVTESVKLSEVSLRLLALSGASMDQSAPFLNENFDPLDVVSVESSVLRSESAEFTPPVNHEDVVPEVRENFTSKAAELQAKFPEVSDDVHCASTAE